MRQDEIYERLTSVDVARLATVRPDGRPHIVPITFALVDGDVVSAVDHKPKSTRELQRLTNIRHEPRVAVLVDRYADDWSQLWWVRIDGRATILGDGDRFARATSALAGRYPAYRDDPPAGPVIVIRPTGWRSWSASP